MWITDLSCSCSGCHSNLGDSYHGDVQVQSWDGPERLLQPISFSRPTHLHTLTLNRSIWLHTHEVWTVCSPLTCPDQVTLSHPIRKQLHLHVWGMVLFCFFGCLFVLDKHEFWLNGDHNGFIFRLYFSPTICPSDITNTWTFHIWPQLLYSDCFVLFWVAS